MRENPSRSLPYHVAIIMDGNGRWARKRNLPRTEGHRVGIEKIREIVEFAQKVGVRVLTVYAFSEQNWKRPKREVDFLMKRLEEYLEREKKKLKDKKIRLRVIGRIHKLFPSLQKKIKEVMELTKEGYEFTFNLAISYGGQEEIVDAVKKLAREVKEGKLSPEEIDEERFSQYLYTRGIPSPDLLIRTSGEQRVSNFLLWQIAYTEFYFTPTLWPDFTREEFMRALEDYKRRERRFGGLRADEQN